MGLYTVNTYLKIVCLKNRAATQDPSFRGPPSNALPSLALPLSRIASPFLSPQGHHLQYSEVEERGASWIAWAESV